MNSRARKMLRFDNDIAALHKQLGNDFEVH